MQLLGNKPVQGDTPPAIEVHHRNRSLKNTIMLVSSRCTTGWLQEYCQTIDRFFAIDETDWRSPLPRDRLPVVTEIDALKALGFPGSALLRVVRWDGGSYDG